MEGRIVYTGENTRLLHTVQSDDGSVFSVGTVTAWIYDSTGSVVVNAAAGAVDGPAAAVTHDVWYAWSPSVSGDYVTLLRYSVGGETFSIRSEITVLSPANKYDRYIDRVARWIKDTPAGEGAQLLTWREYRDAAQAAVRAYEKINPQQRLLTQALASNQFEYPLPADWTPDFSEILAVEYPVDDTVQDRSWLLDREYERDDLRLTYRFLDATPTTGQTARVVYTTEHTLSDSADTVPGQDFECVTQYAAGLALLSLANRSASTSAPTIGADMVNYRTKQQEYAAQGKTFLDLARKQWGPGRSATIATADYLPWHGRLIYWQ